MIRERSALEPRTTAPASGAADLWEAIARPSTLSRDLWEWTGSGFREGSWGDLLGSSCRAAAALRRRGVQRGEIVAAVITNSHAAIGGLVGAWFAGGRVASLPVLARGMSPSQYVAQLRRLIGELDASVLLAEARFLELLPVEDGLGAELVSYESLLEGDGRADPEPLGRDEVVFIQYSSGTTGEPKGAMLTADAIGNQLLRLAEAMELDPERDVGVTWLPLSHDMGLFGCVLCAWAAGIPLLYGTPERFITGPHTWLEDCAAVGATVTAAPPFALDLAARSARRRVSGPLSVRTWLIGADQIDWSRLTQGVEALAPLGVSLESITPAYGLSEATLAVTVGDLREAPNVVDVDGPALMAGNLESAAPDGPRALRLVSAGSPIRDVRLRISESVGEVRVRTPSLAAGYHGNEAETRRTFQDGELRTGDVGLIVDGELYIVGRSDDVIVVGGRNVHAHELETRLGAHPGVRAGNCAMIDPRDGSGSVALVAEIDAGSVDEAALAQALRRTAHELAGVRVRQCLFLPRGRFPKTPTGKIQRFRCRALLADEAAGVHVPGHRQRR
ncbi:MAG TPA: AMP-binding protein [Thermoleophilaceae bacterium]|jgi:acyl-CoA synthetase (AMP-forming)/AMP-acid ligase II